MPLTFRPIRREEVTEVSLLVDAAYAPQRRQLYGNTRLGRWRHYQESKIERYIQREPQGVRVGLLDRRIVAFNVCRSYGRLGWFHTLAVHPQFQGRGIGKQAVADAERYLSGRGATSMALMTWPIAVGNLAFYLALGYRMHGLSVYAYRETQTPVITGLSPFYATLLAMTPDEELENTWRAARMLGFHIMPGLDYVPWLQWSLHQEFAHTLLLWRDHQLAALALCYAQPHTHWAEGKLLLIHPDLSPNQRLWVLEHIRYWARNLGRDIFGLPVDVHSDVPRQLLLPHGFQLFPEAMTNLVKGDALPDPALHFVRFGD